VLDDLHWADRPELAALLLRGPKYFQAAVAFPLVIVQARTA
jgi:hypothetical protein